MLMKISKKRIVDLLENKFLETKLFFNKRAIVIYQMGKVGSTTVYYSLKKQLPFTPIFHVHCLSENTLKEQEEAYQNIGKFPGEVRHLRHGKYLRKHLDKRTNIKWEIITLVREPISREISIFFQQRDRDFPDGIHTSEAIEMLQTSFANFKESTNFACNWFDREVKNNFDINIYNFDFDKQKGYHIIRKEDRGILIIRLEDLNSCFQTSLGEFLLINKSLNILPKNIATKKAYREQYLEVIKQIKIPRDICESIYSSQYVKHFYNDDMIHGFIKQWTKE